MNEQAMKEATLSGLREKEDRLQRELTTVRSYIDLVQNGGTTAAVTSTDNSRPYKAKRKFSKESRQRMAEAQRRRWAAFHASKG